MLVSKKTLINIVDSRIRAVITDKMIARTIALEYLTGLTKAQLNRFNEAVELRRQSDSKLEKLDEVAPDVDGMLADPSGLEYEM